MPHDLTDEQATASLFSGSGPTDAALRSHPWSQTDLGPVSGWRMELRAAVRTVLPSRIPMLLWWGPSLVQIYNEAYAPLIGNLHPAAIGQPAAECWAAIWDEVGPLAVAAQAGEAVFGEDLRIVMNRHGYLEETYWTFSYSPIRGESGHVLGVFVAATDTTSRVAGDRQREMSLDDAKREAATLEDALRTSRRIGMAVGILMHQYRVSDADAFGLLREASQHRNRKVRELAEDVIRTSGLEEDADWAHPSGQVIRPGRMRP